MLQGFFSHAYKVLLPSTNANVGEKGGLQQTLFLTLSIILKTFYSCLSNENGMTIFMFKNINFQGNKAKINIFPSSFLHISDKITIEKISSKTLRWCWREGGIDFDWLRSDAHVMRIRFFSARLQIQTAAAPSTSTKGFIPPSSLFCVVSIIPPISFRWSI